MRVSLRMLLTVALFAGIPAASAQTTLVAGSGTAVLDGDISEWTSTPLMTGRNVELRAMADGEYLYVAATWADATHTVNKGAWEFDGANWVTGAEDEDRIMFIWDLGSTGTDGASCQAFCHSSVMRTNGGFADLWHWKAARTNPIGYLDDTYLDPEDRHSDSGGGAYVNNTDGTLPTHMASSDPNANVDFLAIDAAALAAFDPFQALATHTVAEAVTFNAAAGFTTGATIPFYLLRPATGDRSSVQTAGRWNNGMWTVEFRKPYAAGTDTTDFAVTPGAMIEFTHEIFDNVTSHDAHAFQPAAGTSSADFTRYTLDLSQIAGGVGVEPDGNEVPASFVLEQNYPNPFNPATNIEFEVAATTTVRLSVYDALGKRVAVLTDQEYAPGRYTLAFAASGLPSGIYFYRLDTERYTDTRTMVLLK